MDFSMWMQSPLDWGMLFLSALLIGMSKTGIQGISHAMQIIKRVFGRYQYTSPNRRLRYSAQLYLKLISHIFVLLIATIIQIFPLQTKCST